MSSRPTRSDEREMRRRDREQSRPYEESYRQGQSDEREARAGRAEKRRQVERVRGPSGSPQRLIVGTMALTVTFALLGTELAPAAPKGAKARPVTIMIGGGVATIVLLVVSHAGEAGAEFAEGLALVTMVAAVLTTGKPVWDAIGRLTRTSPTTPTAPGGVAPTTGLPTGASSPGGAPHAGGSQP